MNIPLLAQSVLAAVTLSSQNSLLNTLHYNVSSLLFFSNLAPLDSCDQFLYGAWLSYSMQSQFPRLLIYHSEYFIDSLHLSSLPLVSSCPLIMKNPSFALICLKWCTQYIIHKVVQKSMNPLELNFFSTLVINIILSHSSSLELAVLQDLLLSFFAGVVVVLMPCYILIGADSIKHNSAYISSILVFLSTLFYRNNGIILWLLSYLFQNQTRCIILGCWVLALVVIFVTLVHISSENVVSDKVLNTNRKIWHYIIFAIITPVFFFPDQIQFVKVVLSFLIIGFLQIETMRYCAMPLGLKLDNLLKCFKDARDTKGPVLISYLYLLVGISLPVFMKDSCIGLVVLGIGDSTASIVGKKWRSRSWKWFGSQKTVIGTLAFIFSSFVTCAGLKYAGLNEFSQENYGKLLAVATIGGLVEAWSDLNDNILLPCIMMSAMV